MVSLLPANAAVCLMADRFYGTANLIGLCQEKSWDYRLRLKGNLVVRDGPDRMTTGDTADIGLFSLENVQLMARNSTTDIGIIRDPNHAEPWIIAMAAEPGYGGLSQTTVARLDAIAADDKYVDREAARKRLPERPVPGTRLVREWQGVEHAVTVLDDGFKYCGRPYKSLSAVANAITGTRWSGPVFFGLRPQGEGK